MIETFVFEKLSKCTTCNRPTINQKTILCVITRIKKTNSEHYFANGEPTKTRRIAQRPLS